MNILFQNYKKVNNLNNNTKDYIQTLELIVWQIITFIFFL